MTVMIGIDPHKASHTAVAIDDDERVLGEFQVRASTGQTERLCEWAAPFGEREWAVESARGLGYLLAQQLVGNGERVLDVPPMMAARVRVLGSGRSQKNDPNDARSVAIAALRHPGLNAVAADDHVAVLHLLAKRHRDLARMKNVACCRLHAVLVDLVPGGVPGRVTPRKASELLASVNTDDTVARQRIQIAVELIADVERADTLMAASTKRIETAVAASNTSLLEIHGLGPICAATIIGYTGDIARFPNRDHYATYNATAPIEASSGNKVRHRLNTRGNRHLNHAIHIVAVCQLRPGTQGRAYYDRKIAAGKTSKEAIRALKRQLSDVVYRHLVADAHRARQA